jgi:hypothetical protein
MPDREEILRSLYGAYLLARTDPSGMGHLNLTVEGFWRSFFAAVLVAPAYALLIGEKLAARPEALELGWVVLVHGVAYVLSWLAFPLAALVLTFALSLSRNYVALIVAVNWAQVLQTAAFLVAVLLSLVLPGLLAGLVITMVTVGVLFYQWYVVRTALETTGGIALALVLVDLVLNLAINLSADDFL